MLQTLIKASKQGGKEIMKYWDKNVQTLQKSTPADFCTQADLESEKAILGIIQEDKILSTFNIYAEEAGEQTKKSDYTIFIDPLDGTNNFKTGVSNFSVSIGVAKGNEIICGVIYQPFLDTVYRAEKGTGSFKNGEKIMTNNESDITKCSLSIVRPYTKSQQIKYDFFKDLSTLNPKRIFDNRSVAYDFCLLAEGKLQGMICDAMPIYDFCAGKLIVIEAGAVIKEFKSNGDLSDTFVITNKSNELNQLLCNSYCNLSNNL